MISIAVSESQVMEALWQHGELTPDEIVEKVGPPNGWAESTVKTLIFRLQRKKAIAGAKREGRFLYRALVPRTAYVQAESQGLLDRLFDGSLTPLIHHFAEHRDLTAEEVQQLKALIAEVEKKHG